MLVGFTVGLTGMGGGALMTPIMVLVFRVQPLAAVSSDLVASMIMKPLGGGVHLRRGTVNLPLVRWLVAGSVPAAFCGVLILRALGNGEIVQQRLKLALGAALLVAASSIVVKALLQSRGAGRTRAAFRIRRTATVLVGAAGGLIVGLTSVGSGSLIIVMLLILYPSLTGSELVGTDLVQAIPLVASAALGHLLFGDFRMSLTASLLVGSLPGVYLGARLSSRAPDRVVRPALVLVLLASSMKLLNVPTDVLGWAFAGGVALALPLWGAIDAARRPEAHWRQARLSRRTWIVAQGAGAFLAIGLPLAIVYFAAMRPRLAAAAAS